MKVLQVIDSLGMGGAEVLLCDMHGEFAKKGIECEYYLLHAEGSPLEEKLASFGARIHAPLKASVYSVAHIRALQKHLCAREYDIVHVHLFPAQLWAACGARLAGRAIALVTTEHNTENRRRKRWYRCVDDWMYRQYRSIASISPSTTTNLVQWLPKVQGKIVECPNGINVEAFASAPTAGKASLFSVPAGTPVIMCVASMEPRKDHDTLLRAVSLVPEEAVLVLVGDGQLRKQLQRRACELGLASRVRFLGKRRDVPHLLKAADLYVQPSRVEGFGIAALEAMASGLPIIASNVPGLAEVVGENGLLFPAGDHRCLAECLQLLLKDSALRQQLSAAATARAQMFTVAKTRDCYEALYREVLRESGKSVGMMQ